MAVIEQGEALLWRRACGGDAQAFAAVFDLHRNRVYGQAVRLLDTRSDAEDVAASALRAATGFAQVVGVLPR
ncbi:hypothetical protein ACQP2P_09225 [Dactylosporangium sp. CA-139114]|uniref:hypothetical protein n=1 Tax=Dactylosporangium sp. CA-139114 TaxID=3239931 RepID=UPI003D97E9FF